MKLINKDFSILLPYNKIALAVSGGPDSMAMLCLINNWAKTFKKEIIAITVNHNLRPEAQEECKYVADFCSKNQIKHIRLEWIHEKISSNVHDQARKARYDLMSKYCLENSVDVLCTAHHMDDRVENFLIKVHRGSGLLGLIDKQEITYNGLKVIRPLFNWKKSDILDYLDKNNIRYFEDPSNEDPKYLRSNIRKWLKLMPKELDYDFFASRVIALKNNLERPASLVEQIFEKEFNAKVEIHNEGYVTITSLPQDKEIAYMLLSKAINMVGVNEHLVRLESIERLYNAILMFQDGAEPSLKQTLGGCVIELKGADKVTQKPYNIVIYREFGKKPPLPSPIGSKIIWDNRFSLNFKDSDQHEGLYVSYLTQELYSGIRKDLPITDQLLQNKQIIFTLPVITDDKQVIAIPHLNYYNQAYSDIKEKIEIKFIRHDNYKDATN